MKTDLVEIFQTIRANLQPYSTNGFSARVNSETLYELWCEKALDLEGNAMQPSLFSSVEIQSQKVVFSLIPVEKEPELTEVIHEDLLKLSTQAGKFEITKLDDILTEQISDALVAGYTIYKQKGWV